MTAPLATGTTRGVRWSVVKREVSPGVMQVGVLQNDEMSYAAPYAYDSKELDYYAKHFTVMAAGLRAARRALRDETRETVGWVVRVKHHMMPAGANMWATYSGYHVDRLAKATKFKTAAKANEEIQLLWSGWTCVVRRVTRKRKAP